MSGPSFSNIDRWLFEYVEGNLSKEQEAQLEEFILNNPELELDLDSWQASKVEPVIYEYPNSESLHRIEKRKRRLLPYFIGAMGIATIIVLSLNWNNSPETILTGNQKKSGVKHEKQKNNHKSPQIVHSSSAIKLANNQKISNTPIFQNVNSNGKISVLNFKELSTKDQNLNSVNLETAEIEKNKNSVSHEIKDVENEISGLTENQTNFQIDSSEVIKIDLKQSKATLTKNKKSINETHKSLSIGKILNKIEDYMGNEIGLKNTRDHQIHVPGMSQLDANFSSVGDVSSTRFRSLSRAQWLTKENQLFSNQLSLDWYSKSLKSGFGIQANYKYYGNGVIQDWNTALIYSPKILLSKSMLIEPGIRFKMGNKFLNETKASGLNQVELDRNNAIDFYANGSIPIGTKLWYRDLGASILVHSKWFYLGAQLDNLLNHNDNIYSNDIANPRKMGNYFSFKMGTDYESKSGKIAFSPYLYYEKFENREESWGGFNFQFKAWAFGGAVSNNSNLAVSTGLRFSNFAITYQFDRTYSNLLGVKANSHQLGITINSKVSRSPRRYIRLK